MPDETVEQLINRLNDICAPVVKDPGEAMKKTQVIKDICNEIGAFSSRVFVLTIYFSEFIEVVICISLHNYY